MPVVRRGLASSLNAPVGWALGVQGQRGLREGKAEEGEGEWRIGECLTKRRVTLRGAES
jgi:hypothetical protein